MKRRELKKVLNLAIKKRQDIIVIYTNKIARNDLYNTIKNGNPVYKKAIDEANGKQEKTVIFARSAEDDVLIAFICVPVEKLKNSEEYFDEILKYCNEHLISGPFVLIPSNEEI